MENLSNHEFSIVWNAFASRVLRSPLSLKLKWTVISPIVMVREFGTVDTLLSWRSLSSFFEGGAEITACVLFALSFINSPALGYSIIVLAEDAVLVIQERIGDKSIHCGIDFSVLSLQSRPPRSACPSWFLLILRNRAFYIKYSSNYHYVQHWG